MELSNEELSQRVAIIKRFKSLLEQQKAKFQEYLNVLELQQGKIEKEDAEAILAHTQLEEQIVSNIGTLQKVIVPIEQMYNSFGSPRLLNTEEKALGISLSKVQSDLNDLHSRIQIQTEQNQALLRAHMASIRQQLSDMKNPYRNTRSVYAPSQGIGSLVQINA